MTELKSPFRYDYVGSFLRPAAVKEARAKFAKNEITKEQLTEVENEEIKKLVEKQKAAGFHGLTDGEFRRSYWHLDFMWGFGGIEHVELDHGYFFQGEETTHGSIKVTGKITGKNHPFVEHYKFVKQFEDETTVARQTFPAPAQLLAELFREDNGKDTVAVYPDEDKLIEDIAAAYRQVIKDLYDAGCRNIQFDDCTWGIYCDTDFVAKTGMSPVDLQKVSELGVALNNAAIEGKPDDLVINTHVCRGNYHSTYAFEGGYDPVAPYLFAHEDVDAFYLEFDTPRAGGFEPLKYVAPGKKVVLGLVTTKAAELEDEDAIVERIHEAAKYVPLENLYLSPQCGFASCEIGNKLTEDEQWAKIALVKRIAERVWK